MQRALRIERLVAACELALVVAYVTTERSPSSWLLGWSQRWTALVFSTLAASAFLLCSYSTALPGWFRTVRRITVASLAAVAMLLVGTELALRASDAPAFEELDNSGRHAPDPDVGHVYVPSHRQTLQTREYRVDWSSNAVGLRAEREVGPKAPGVVRILCSGDSFTACDQVPYSESWPAVLEARLNARLEQGGSARRVEVLNAGFPGFSTANEAAWLAKFAPPLDPDIVLVATTPNDLSENPFPLQYTARDGRLVSASATAEDEARFEHRRQWWCIGGALERSRLAQRIVASTAWAKLRGKPPFHHAEAYQSPRGEKAQRLHALADRCMLEARDASLRLGARFGIVVIPYSRQLRDFADGYDGAAWGRHWREFASQHDLPCADARERFLAYGGTEPLYWREDNHCTAAGYALVAEAAADMLWERRDELGWTP